MKRHLCARGISLLLACVFILMCASCERGEQNGSAPETEGKRLTVDTVEVIYDDLFKEQISRRAADIFARFVKADRGIVLKEEQKAELAQSFREEYIPIFQGEGVRAEELEEILLLCGSLCDKLEKDKLSGTRDRLMSFCELYRDAVALIGTKRAGRVTYDSLCNYLNGRIEYYDERYEQYGYQWYRSRAEETRARLTSLTQDVGRDTFTEAMTVPAFAATVSGGVLSSTDGAVDSMIYDGDIKEILEFQSEYFLSLEISAYQWRVIGEAFSSLEGGEPDSLLGTSLQVLREEETLARSAECMPQLLNVYAAFVSSIEIGELSALRSAETEDERMRMICAVLVRCPDELNGLFAAVEKNCATKSEAEYDVIGSAGMLSEYEEFTNKYPPIDSGALFGLIADCAEGKAEKGDVGMGLLRYLEGSAPYLAFAIYADEKTEG